MGSIYKYFVSSQEPRVKRAALIINHGVHRVSRSEKSNKINILRETPCTPFAAHKAVCLAGESPAVGIGCMPT